MRRQRDMVPAMTANGLQDVLRRAEAWPQEDQDALVEYAREIEARRTGVYRLSEDERAAIEEARQEEPVAEADVDAFWKRLGVT
jgi:hypothetical protein